MQCKCKYVVPTNLWHLEWDFSVPKEHESMLWMQWRIVTCQIAYVMNGSTRADLVNTMISIRCSAD